RPTPALHLTRVTLCLRELNAEPHTKEVGHGEVYYHHCLRSARRNNGGRGAPAAAADATASFGDLGHSDDSALCRPTATHRTRAVLLRGRPLWLRVAARTDDETSS